MSELITKLGIDWKLLIAQIVNFGILVYVLKRFVYTPIVAALENRRKDISDTKEKAAGVEIKIQEIETEKQKVLQSARLEAKEILKKAESNAKKHQEESLKVTEQKAASLLQEGERNLEKEKSKIRTELKNEIGSVVSAAVEKTIGQYLTKDAEEKLKAEALAIIRENESSFR